MTNGWAWRTDGRGHAYMLYRKTRSRSWKGVAVLGALPHFVRGVCQVPTPFQRSYATAYSPACTLISLVAGLPVVSDMLVLIVGGFGCIVPVRLWRRRLGYCAGVRLVIPCRERVLGYVMRLKLVIP